MVQESGIERLLKQPKSSFLRVKCECGSEMVIFDHAKNKIVCEGENCDTVLAIPAGGKVRIQENVEILEKLR